MGSKQSALKKEINSLRHEARKTSAKHEEELAAATNENRRLQLKFDELQAIASKAQLEVEKSKSELLQQEERMKALKWELVRQLKMSGHSPTSGSTRALLSPPASSSPRISLNWKLNDDVVLRQSIASPKKPGDPLGNDSSESILSPSRTEAKNPAPIISVSKVDDLATDADAKKINKTTIFDTKHSIDDPSSSNAIMIAEDEGESTREAILRGGSKNDKEMLSFSDDEE